MDDETRAAQELTADELRALAEAGEVADVWTIGEPPRTGSTASTRAESFRFAGNETITRRLELVGTSREAAPE